MLNMLHRFGLDTRTGAQTSLHCALDESLAEKSGCYYDNCKEKSASKNACNPDTNRKVWDTTVQALTDYIKP